MRQVIPFSKDITFKTKIDSITSISLEHTLKLDNDNTISGSFTVSGDYKITTNSNKLELFNYNIPFDIVLDNSYKIEESTIDIDDFYYEIVDDDVLRINIDVAIEGEEIEEIKDEVSVEDEILASLDKKIDTFDDETFIFEPNEVTQKEEVRNETIEDSDNMIEEKNETKEENKNMESMFSVINNDDDETFTTYNVHIVQESETMESIIKKYNITKEQFLEYNQENEVSVGNKLLIPANNE